MMGIDPCSLCLSAHVRRDQYHRRTDGSEPGKKLAPGCAAGNTDRAVVEIHDLPPGCIMERARPAVLRKVLGFSFLRRGGGAPPARPTCATDPVLEKPAP